ncbi:FAD-dependent oxidoreductase [Nibrella viscosa]|uniref:FAD-dependent oxidoreductase n=1 Tax=Nibrella viscosa TaxID=1084524 RepID=A0ABP8K9Y2_9BACT
MKTFLSLLVCLPGFSCFVTAQPLSVDVCVYGGTSAGVIAAYTAKKAGKSVVLIEPTRHLGGLSSGGLGATDIGNKFAITGLARDFYRRVGKHYGRLEQWTFEPHVAKALFNQYLQEAGVPTWYEYRIVSARKNQRGTIEEIVLEQSDKPGVAGQRDAGQRDAGQRNAGQRIVRAKQYIDCTYEGDLMARAGVSYTVGREANSLYGETYNGVQLLDKHQFPDGVDPYNIPGKPESGLVWGISTAPLQPNGTGDRSIQAYNYRMCLTDNPDNRIPITRPARYDSTKYELLLRQIDKKVPKELTWNLMHFVMMPNRKTDINNCGGLSTDMIGANYDYPEASYERRAAIIREHEDYTKGFFYFIGHDPRVPEHLRQEMQQWGYPKDEYVDNDHFSPQLYVREARRMVGEYVMTQANCESKVIVGDGVGMAAYTMDSHNCQRLIVRDAQGRAMVRNEGDVQVGGFPPYPISYRALVPKRTECTNLLVPVCLSASHIAYGSIRMEPVFMVLAQSAAMAASMAIDANKAVQDIDVPKLQALLRSNPLADGSRPEQLIDNDDPRRVVIKGDWQRETTGGRYGFSMLIGKPAETNEAASVRFSLTDGQPGTYAVYVYNPIRQGGTSNPDTYGQQTDKASRVVVKLNTGKDIKQLFMNQQQQANDWISLGQHQVVKGTTPYLELTSQGANGTVVADAVLFLPVK